MYTQNGPKTKNDENNTAISAAKTIHILQIFGRFRGLYCRFVVSINRVQLYTHPAPLGNLQMFLCNISILSNHQETCNLELNPPANEHIFSG